MTTPDPTADPAADADAQHVAALGATVRVERGRRGLSVAALAERAGVSFGLISHLERGQGNPSFKAVQRIARALEIPLATLLAGGEGDRMVVRADERELLPMDPAAPPEQRVVRELLTPRLTSTLQLIRSRLPVGFTNESQPFRHLGTEVVTVECGALLVVHGERRTRLLPGDSATYTCSTPHWWANDCDEETVVLGAVTPFEA